MAESTLVVLAAGMGSRYGGLKQVEPAGPNGELLVEYAIYDALSVGIRRVVFVIQRDQEDAFRSILVSKLEGTCDVFLAYQDLTDLPPGNLCPAGRIKPWGTGHALLSARHVVDGPLVVINADDFYGRASYQRLAEFLVQPQRSHQDHALVGFHLRTTLTSHGAVSRGVCMVGENNLLTRIDERTRIGYDQEKSIVWHEGNQTYPVCGDAIVSMNMWAFSEGFMDDLLKAFAGFLRSPASALPEGEFFLPAVVSSLILEHRARVHVLPTSAAWIGVTYREDLPHVKQAIQTLVDQQAYPLHLWDHLP